MNKTITLTDEQEKLVAEKMQSGDYASEKAVIEAGLRLLDERDRQLKQLRAEIQKGIESGEPIPAEQVFARIEKKLEAQGKHAKQ